MTRFLIVLALCMAPVPALAHKVIAGVFPAGDAIEGEVGFSNGDMATDAEIIVTDPDGAELGRTDTDADGFFLFKPTKAMPHTFTADLGAGHVMNVTMPADEVAAIMGKSLPDKPRAAKVTLAAAGSIAPARTETEREIIAKAMRDEIRPLRREIAAYREHNDFQTILGGIGYIFGLFGLGFYLAARRKMAA